MIDTADLAALLGAMREAPGRLAALERQTAAVAAGLEAVRAALPPTFATVTEAANALKVSVPTMRRWVKAGRVPTLKVGNTVRVDLSRMKGLDASEVGRRAAALRVVG